MNDSHSLFYVALVNAIIWGGLFFYIWRLDRKVRRIEREDQS
ncbi:MAG TPA: CcmD family protein [Thermoanaerobaculia bacterium]|nr:CcmD family protein [Thermoanaerobaculia bacterium]HUM29466.1 CcmD family protein [Thermoanaerobaculia bacterium]HXK67849.1 CcmD family protein [Thermoanaerobaculia bacterium]